MILKSLLVLALLSLTAETFQSSPQRPEVRFLPTPQNVVDAMLTLALFQADLSSATVVAIFLLPSMNMRLIPRFQRELRPGARIVSHHFAMGDRWEPDPEQDVSGLMIYLWNMK